MKVKKYIFLILFLAFNFVSYAKVKISIYEPIRFEKTSTRELSQYVKGTGVIEITTDDLEEDENKKIVLNFAESGLLTNGRRFIRVEKFEVDKKDKEFEIKEKSKRITFYALVHKSELNDMVRTGEDIEGVYYGRLNIVAELYGKPKVVKEEASKWKNIF